MITFKEFESKLHTDDVREFFKAIDVCVSEADALFRLIDTEGKGVIHLNQFMHCLLKLRGPAKSLDLTLLMIEADQNFNIIINELSGISQALDQVNPRLTAQDRT